MNGVAISSDYTRVGMHRHPEDGEIEVVVFPSIAAQGKTGMLHIAPHLNVLVSVNGKAPELTEHGQGYYSWPLAGIAGQVITLRYGGGAAGAIPKETEVALWAE